MSKRTFEEAFNAVFHDKSEFTDFLSLDLEKEIKSFEIDSRTVFRASDKLKKYLRFIDRVILRSLAKDEDVAHAFVKGKSTLTAVKAHIRNKYFFLTDIREFYSNIETDDVRRILKRDIELLPISDIEHYIELIVNMATVDGSLPIGFPTSPQLSNAFLYEFDRAVKAFCSSHSLTYTRYADDVIISGQTFNELSDLRNVVQKLLKTHASSKLSLKESKTHITQLGNKVKILGLVILPNGRVTIDTKYKNDIESLLHFYLTNKEKYNNLLAKKFRGDERSLFGVLHYANSIDPAYLDKLQRKYGVYTLRTLMVDKWNDQR